MKDPHKRQPKDQVILRALQLICNTMLLDRAVNHSSHPQAGEPIDLSLFTDAGIWIFRSEDIALAEQAVRVVNSNPPPTWDQNERLVANNVGKTIHLSYDGFQASFPISNTFAILEDFEKQTRLPAPWRPKNRHDAPEPFTKKEWLQVAEQYDSAEEVLNDPEFVAIKENLTAAQSEPELHPDGSPTMRPKKIALWQEQLTKWEILYNHALTLDYEWIIEQRKERELTRQAEENKQIQKLIKKMNSEAISERQYQTPRSIFDLFAAFHVEPKADIALFLSLYYANQILERHNEPWGDIVQDHIDTLKAKLHDRQQAFNTKYLTKKGQFRSLSGYKARQRRDDESDRITEDEQEILTILKHKTHIEKHIETLRLTVKENKAS